MKLLVTQIPVVMHTKLKWYASRQGLPMSKIVRALITGWLAGEFDISDQLRGDKARVGRPTGVHQDDGEPDFYDMLYEKVSQAVES